MAMCVVCLFKVIQLKHNHNHRAASLPAMGELINEGKTGKQLGQRIDRGDPVQVVNDV